MALVVIGVAFFLRNGWSRPREPVPFNPPPAPPPPPPPAPPPSPVSELYAADLGGQQIFGFELTLDPTQAPTLFRRFGFNQMNSGLVNPSALTANPSKEIWVVNRGVSPLQPPGSQPPNVPSISVYSDNTQGAVTPLYLFPSLVPPGGIFRTLENPVAVAWRNSPPNLLVADARLGTVWEFTTEPVPTGSAIGFARPSGVAVDSSQQVYVSDQDPAGARVWIFSMHAQQFGQTPITSLQGPATQLRNPGHLALDGQGSLYVVNEGGPQDRGDILVFAPGASGNVPPLRRIFSTDASDVIWSDPRSVAVDVIGRIFVSAGNRILVFAAGADGNVAPKHVLSDPNFGDVWGLSIR
jgi:hypothetical protein